MRDVPQELPPRGEPQEPHVWNSRQAGSHRAQEAKNEKDSKGETLF